MFAVKMTEVEGSFKVELGKNKTRFLKRRPTMGKLPYEGKLKWLGHLVDQILGDFESRLAMVGGRRD